METSSSRIYGYIASGIFALVVFLILWMFALPIKIPVRTPPEGIDVLTTINTIGGGMPSGGSVESGSTTTTSGGASSDMMSTTNHSTHTTGPNHNTNNNTNDWGDTWSNSENNGGNSGNNSGGNGGDGPGGPGHGGTGNCIGCRGSGTGLGNGDASHLVVPKIRNQDEGTVVVKVTVRPDGTVSDAVIQTKGTTGDISQESRNLVLDAARNTKFKPEPGISEMRTGLLTYKLRPN